MLRRFFPALLITTTRSGELSAAANTHRLLVHNGVRAELHVWHEFDHGFYNETQLPEPARPSMP